MIKITNAKQTSDQFRQQVATALAPLSRQQLQELITEWAPKIPAKDRAGFLALLNVINPEKTGPTSAEKELTQRWEALQEDLTAIDDEEIALEFDPDNAPMDDWENEDYYYVDQDGIGDYFRAALQLADDYVAVGNFQLAQTIVARLLQVQVAAREDNNPDPITTLTLEDYELEHVLGIDHQKVVLKNLGLLYLATPVEERPAVLFPELVKNGFKLNDLIEASLPVPGLDDFLPVWLNYLLRSTERGSQKLLSEALTLSKGSLRQDPWQLAATHADQHPELYRDALKSQLVTAQNDRQLARSLLEKGLPALKQINLNLRVREEVATILAKLAGIVGEATVQEKCLEVALTSDTTLENYFRLIFGYRAPQMAAKRAQAIVNQLAPYDPQQFHSPIDFWAKEDSQTLNRPSDLTRVILHFFCGDFPAILDECLPEHFDLEDDFAEEGHRMLVVLYILLLVNKEQTGPGTIGIITFFLAKMRDDFTFETVSEELVVFRTNFFRWRDHINQTPIEARPIVQRLVSLIDGWVARTLSRKVRKEYGLVATFIAALGEAKQSLGIGTAQSELDYYYHEYRRFPAFRRELEAVGYQPK